MKIGISLLVLLFFIGCSVEPQIINYGKDACSSCKMNIVDQQHAAEIVTKKGKCYKYDAIECLIRDTENNHPDKTALVLVMDYNNPNAFLNADEATFLISENIPSPMGAFLSAFSTKEEAEIIQKAETGTLFSWNQIRKEIN